MSMVSDDQPRRRARMTSRAGGTQDSGGNDSMYEEGETYINPATGREEIFLMGELRPKYPMGKSSISEQPQRLQKLNEGFAKSGLFANEIPPRFGGNIPSPRQSYEMPSRRPGAAGGDRMERERVAQLRSLLGQMQMPVPPMPGMSDMGSTVPGEGMNRPAPDINDAFFGPDRKRFDVVEFLMGLMGRR